MKRKRRSESTNDFQTCDVILIDANGRSIRVHRALLMDRSDYFARLLAENRITELQLNENYLIELIQYLYNHESDQVDATTNNESFVMTVNQRINDGDIEILMNLLNLAKKYQFRQLYRSLMKEINYRLRPSTVLGIFKLAFDANIDELVDTTRMMILTWLPQLQLTDSFYELPESAIYSIFEADAPDIDNECKLNALSTWWSHNKDSDMTDLWVKLNTYSK